MIGYDLRDSVGAETYTTWLEKGFGRAILYMQRHDSKPLRDAILHAVTHDLRFDSQFEKDRGDYLYRIMTTTGEPDFYRSRLLDELPGLDTEEGQTCQYYRNPGR